MGTALKAGLLRFCFKGVATFSLGFGRRGVAKASDEGRTGTIEFMRDRAAAGFEVV